MLRSTILAFASALLLVSHSVEAATSSRTSSATTSRSSTASSASSTASSTASSSTNADLYADSWCNTNVCLTTIYSPSQNMMNMTMTASGGGAPIGWYSVGTGSKMAGSNMMIGWVNNDGSVMMSQRTASGHNDPTTTLSAKAAILDTKKTFSNSSGTAWSWTFPLSSTDTKPSKSTQFIWAINKSNNPTASTSAQLKKHSDYGGFTLDLTKPYNASTAGTAGSTGSSVVTPGTASASQANSNRILNRQNKLIIAHMVFMILAWFIMVPIAILIGRYGRTIFKWFPVHRNIQIAAFVAVLIGFILIVVEVAQTGGSHFDSNHAKVGLAILIVMFLQMGLGQIGHLTKRFNVSRIVHVVIGLGVTVAAIWNSAEGLSLWDWGPPKWASYVLWAWAALMALIYLAGLILLPKDLREWKAQKQESEKDTMAYTHRQDSGTYLGAESPLMEHFGSHEAAPQHPGWGAPPLQGVQTQRY